MYINLKKNKSITKIKEEVSSEEVSVSLNFFKNKFIKKDKEYFSIFYIYVKPSIRGFFVNILDYKGKVLNLYTTGKFGFKKASRYNRESLRALIIQVYTFFKKLPLSSFKFYIILKGFNKRRSLFIRMLIKSLYVFRHFFVAIVELTDLPYNGCRPKKLRRK